MSGVISKNEKLSLDEIELDPDSRACFVSGKEAELYDAVLNCQAMLEHAAAKRKREPLSA